MMIDVYLKIGFENTILWFVPVYINDTFSSLTLYDNMFCYRALCSLAMLVFTTIISLHAYITNIVV